MAQPPWKDALARARRAGDGRPAPTAPLRAVEAARAGAPSADALAAQAPGLQQLLAERQALEQRMLGLTGGNPADPRYAVEPLDRRRAALAAWGQSRDAARGARRDPVAAFAPLAPPLRGTNADMLRATAADVLRGTNADVLRATPGELPGADRPRRLFEPFERPAAANDEPLLRPEAGRPESRRARREAQDDGPPLGEAGRQLGQAGRQLANAGRSLDDARQAARPEPERPRSQSPDPLDRRLARARDMAARARRPLDKADRALDSARDAIPGDWQDRARDRIPGLGKADHYVRETARKLSTLAGAVDDIGSKADRLRGLARDMRELKAADEANDEARRERALDRLKTKRQEG